MREIRRKKCIFAKILAQRVGCSADHISRIENGKTPPGMGLAEKIAKTLCIAPESLYLPPGSTISPISTSGLSPDERELLDAYRRLPASFRDFVNALTLNLTQAEKGETQQEAIDMARGYQAVQDTRRASVESASKRSKSAG